MIKKTTFRFLLLLLLVSCSGKKEKLSLTGQVTNYNEEFLLFLHDTIGYGLGYTRDTVLLDKDGQFNIEVDSLNSQGELIWLDENRTSVLLPKGLTGALKLRLDLDQVDSMEISGKQAAFVKYESAQNDHWVRIYEEMSQKHPVLAKGDNQQPQYHLIQDTITKKRLGFLREYFSEMDMEGQGEFINTAGTSLIYANLYYRMQGQDASVIKEMDFYNPGNTGSAITFSDQVRFDDKNLFSHGYYRNFTNEFILKSISLAHPKKKGQPYGFYLDKGYEVIEEWFDNPETRGLQKVLFMDELLTNAIMFRKQIDGGKFQQEIATLQQDRYSKDYAAGLEGRLETLREEITYLETGSAAPNFRVEDLNGKAYGLADFKDKLVVVDVWAGWCRPCVKSFPKWNELIEENKDNGGIEFLTVSVDEARGAWEKDLAKYGVGGRNFYAGEGGFQSDFAKSFRINLLPYYLVINRDGSIHSVSQGYSEFEESLARLGL